MRVIGIVGGIASGKSEVARRLEQRGAVLLDADRLGHEALRLDSVREALRTRWGGAVFHADGTVDRKAVAQRVFGDDAAAVENRKFLEDVVHPYIAAGLRRQLRGIAEATPDAIVVLDAALLFEAGWDQFCDEVAFVDVSRRERLRRAAARGWTPQQYAAREVSQMPVEEKRRRADRVLTNEGSREELQEQVDRWWSDLMAGLPP